MLYNNGYIVKDLVCNGELFLTDNFYRGIASYHNWPLEKEEDNDSKELTKLIEMAFEKNNFIEILNDVELLRKYVNHCKKRNIDIIVMKVMSQKKFSIALDDLEDTEILGYDCMAGDNVSYLIEVFEDDNIQSFDNIKKYMDEDDIEYVRYYVSDRTSFKLVTDQLENKKPGEKMFLFNVTMQNHGGYTYDGGEFPTVTISNLQGHYKEAEQYLSLIKESDKAFEELVRYLKNYDEPTIVVMFGDHQPAVEQEFYEELYGKSLSKLSTEELQQRYKIPFVIWANYDIESQDDLKTSPNYLSDLLLDTANVPKNEIENFTSEVRNDVPQINAMGHYDSDGNWVSRDEDTSNALDEYEAVEYYMLTRKENKDAKENKDDKK